MAVGRPRKYTPEQEIEAVNRCRHGETPAEVARSMGLPESTVRLWVKQAADLTDAEVVRERIERSSTTTTQTVIVQVGADKPPPPPPRTDLGGEMSELIAGSLEDWRRMGRIIDRAEETGAQPMDILESLGLRLRIASGLIRPMLAAGVQAISPDQGDEPDRLKTRREWIAAREGSE